VRRDGAIAVTTPTGFADWIPYILDDEGPEVNASSDEPGGVSKYGVSLTTYRDYCRATKLPVPVAGDVADLTANGASAFYSWFLGDMMLDQLPAALAYRVADLAVTLGREGAVDALCSALGVWPVPTAMTAALVAAAKAADQTCLLWSLSGAWLATKRAQGGAAGRAKYGDGWNARRNKVHARATAMVTWEDEDELYEREKAS